MHANIYIRKDNEDIWESMEDRSDWVNRKLAEEKNGTLKPFKRVVNPVFTDGKVLTPAPYNTPIVLNNDQVKELKQGKAITGPLTQLTPRTTKVCKNGHPIPEGRDKCLGKGCKYA